LGGEEGGGRREVGMRKGEREEGVKEGGRGKLRLYKRQRSTPSFPPFIPPYLLPSLPPSLPTYLPTCGAAALISAILVVSSNVAPPTMKRMTSAAALMEGEPTPLIAG